MSLSQSPDYSYQHIRSSIETQSTNSSLLKDCLQYLAAASIFIIYGIQVCPFLESLEFPFFISVVFSLFTLMFIARQWLIKSVKKQHITETINIQFKIDIGVFFIGGLVLAIGNKIAYNFPIEASFRVLIGFLFLGYFIGLQLNLQKEFQLLRSLNEDSINNKPEKPSSITKKIRFITLSLLISSLVIITLVILKDFEWLKNVGRSVSLEQATLWITIELAFVMSIFIIYGWLILNKLSKNIDLHFHYQNTTLDAMQSGKRDIIVPILSNDEFSIMAKHTNYMIESLKQNENLLTQTRDTAILAISSLAETRDNETGAHILRTQEYVKALGVYLQKDKSLSTELSDEKLEMIYKSAPLHDIGKVGIPDSILLKPGKLTDDEFEIMKTHALIGKQAIEKAEETMGEIPFLHYAKEISASHHEKWDGSGYPNGLKGDNIPLSGRLMALADVYDALISQRVYKPAFSHDKSKSIILEGKGKHFDPRVVDAFLAIENEFIAIAKAFKDG